MKCLKSVAMKTQMSGFFFLILFLNLVSCQNKESKSFNERVVGERLAPSEISESLRSETAQNQNRLVIKKSSLGKAFLLVTSLKTPARDSQWSDFAPVLVSFERSANRIAMFELVQKIYSAIEPEQLISSFKIISETSDEIQFDFDMGLSFVPMKSTFEDPGKSKELIRQNQDGETNSFRIKDSFIRSIKNIENTLVIEQNYRIEEQKIVLIKRVQPNNERKEVQTLITTEKSYLANIQIKPYRANEQFGIRELPSVRNFGFFTIGKQTQSNSEVKSIAMHWDTEQSNEKIRVQLSTEIPDHIKGAVTEGVDYWNRVLGKEILIVEKDIKTSNIPTSNRVITIRWIPYDDAGYAYASLQADPLTGELLRGQMYLTSTFLKLVEGDSLSSNSSSNFQSNIQISGLKELSVCNIFSKELPKKFNWVADSSIRKELAKDIIRWVVAHEMGHLMGLRHNFSASYASDASLEQITKLGKDYSNLVDHPGAAVVTSVMDYPDEKSEALIGRSIKSKQLKYDTLALNWARTGDIDDELKKMPYCSDEEVMLGRMSGLSVLGCAAGDEGNDPFNEISLKASKSISLTLDNKYTDFLSKAFPKGIQSTDLMFTDALSILSNFYFSIDSENSLIKKSILIDSENYVKSISIESIQSEFWQKEWFDWSDPKIKSYAYTFIEALKKETSKTDLGYVLRNILMLDDQLNFLNQNNRYVEHFASESILKSGKTKQGVEYELSDEQVLKIKNAIKKSLDNNVTSLIEAQLRSLLPNSSEKVLNPFSDTDMSLSKSFFKTIGTAILLRNEGPLNGRKIQEANYSNSIREILAGALIDKRWFAYQLTAVLSEERLTVLKLFRKQFAELLKVEPSQLESLNSDQISSKIQASQSQGLISYLDFSVASDDLKIMKILE